MPLGTPPNGKKVVVWMASIWRAAEGKLVEWWINMDTLGLMQQLGILAGVRQAQAGCGSRGSGGDATEPWHLTDKDGGLGSHSPSPRQGKDRSGLQKPGGSGGAKSIHMTEPSPVPSLTTFVVRFWHEWSAAGPRWRGHILHVQSGDSAAFLDAEAMLAFIGRFASMADDESRPSDQDTNTTAPE